MSNEREQETALPERRSLKAEIELVLRLFPGESERR